MPKNTVITNQDLMGWPNHWPPSDKFLGSLTFDIISLNFKSSYTEHRVIIRFRNRYGVEISENFINEGLYLVAILRFYGADQNEYNLVHNSPIPELSCCFSSHDVFQICQEVAQWKGNHRYSKRKTHPEVSPH